MSRKFSDVSLKSLSAYGAALTAGALANHVEAVVVPLTASPTSVAPNSGNIDFVELPGGDDLFLWNDGVGNTFYPIGALNGVRPTALSNMVTLGQSFAGNLNLASASANGTFFVGFRTTSNQVGWFQYQVNAVGSNFILAAAYNDEPGGTIRVGDLGASIPEPASAALAGLSALALGSMGVRRNRSRAA